MSVIKQKGQSHQNLEIFTENMLTSYFSKKDLKIKTDKVWVLGGSFFSHCLAALSSDLSEDGLKVPLRLKGKVENEKTGKEPTVSFHLVVQGCWLCEPCLLFKQVVDWRSTGWVPAVLPFNWRICVTVSRGKGTAMVSHPRWTLEPRQS